MNIGGKEISYADIKPFLQIPWCGFDAHWHGRHFEHWKKDTLAHSLALAYAAGLEGLAAMPNPEPPLITGDLCRAYKSLADESGVPIKFFVNIGLTPDAEQIKHAIASIRKYSFILSAKAFLGRSTGSLSIIEEDEQYDMWDTLAGEGYDGLVIGHFEDEKVMDDNKFDRSNPKTWSTICRPEIAETSSFDKNIKMAVEAKYNGRIHVAHVSTLYVVDEIDKINAPDSNHPLKGRISCGLTPHHGIFNNDILNSENGLEYKCNPALRAELTRAGLLAALFDGRIQMLESDHAPHTHGDKHPADPKAKPASGLAVGSGWPYVVGLLRYMGMPEERVRQVTFDNPIRIFGVKGVDYNPRVPDLEALAKQQSKYHFDPFACLKS